MAAASIRCSRPSGPLIRSRIGERRRCCAFTRRPYLDFLKSAFADWKAAGRAGDAAGYVWPVVGRRPLDLDRIDARLGQYSMDASTPIAEGTWESAYWSAQTALEGLEALLAGGSFGLRALPPARPPFRRRLCGRLLLSEQCGGGGRGRPRGGRRPGRDPRRGLSSRQRHPGYLPGSRRRLLRLDPRRSAHRLSLISGAMATSAAPAKGKGRPSTCRFRTAPAGATTRRRWNGRWRRSPASAPGS